MAETSAERHTLLKWRIFAEAGTAPVGFSISSLPHLLSSSLNHLFRPGIVGSIEQQLI
jgi:hypothetical protein